MILDLMVLDNEGKIVFYKSFTGDIEEIRAKHLRKIAMLADAMTRMTSEILTDKTEILELAEYRFYIKRKKDLIYLISASHETNVDMNRIAAVLEPLIKSKQIENLSRRAIVDLIQKLEEYPILISAKIEELSNILDDIYYPAVGEYDITISDIPSINLEFGESLSELPKTEVKDFDDLVKKYYCKNEVEVLYKLNYLLDKIDKDNVKALFVYHALRYREFEEQENVIKFSEIVKLAMKIKNPMLKNFLESTIMSYTSFSGMEREYINKISMSEFIRLNKEKILEDPYIAFFFDILSMGLNNKRHDFIFFECDMAREVFNLYKSVSTLYVKDLSKIVEMLSKSIGYVKKLIYTDKDELLFLALDTLLNLIYTIASNENRLELACDVTNHLIRSLIEENLESLLKRGRVPISKKYLVLSELLLLTLYTWVKTGVSKEQMEILRKAAEAALRGYIRSMGIAIQKPLYFYRIICNYLLVLDLIKYTQYGKTGIVSKEVLKNMIKDDLVGISKYYLEHVIDIILSVSVIAYLDSGRNKDVGNFIEQLSRFVKNDVKSARIMGKLNMIKEVLKLMGKNSEDLKWAH